MPAVTVRLLVGSPMPDRSKESSQTKRTPSPVLTPPPSPFPFPPILTSPPHPPTPSPGRSHWRVRELASRGALAVSGGDPPVPVGVAVVEQAAPDRQLTTAMAPAVDPKAAGSIDATGLRQSSSKSQSPAYEDWGVAEVWAERKIVDRIFMAKCDAHKLFKAPLEGVKIKVRGWVSDTGLAREEDPRPLVGGSVVGINQEEVLTVDLTEGPEEEGKQACETAESAITRLTPTPRKIDDKASESPDDEIKSFFQRFMTRKGSTSSIGDGGAISTPGKRTISTTNKRSRPEASPREEEPKKTKHFEDSEKNKIFKIKGMLNSMFRQVLALEKIIASTHKPKREIKDLTISLAKKVELIKCEGLENIIQTALDNKDKQH
ncbi:hypothetical protein ABEB36_015558 [Hypothenemus hampei]|uniref:Uncharacterized protein n=1 Tax=Hypothenemus hampei TaxID=57062 RepID=A0ABD1DZH6_HYPHA